MDKYYKEKCYSLKINRQKEHLDDVSHIYIYNSIELLWIQFYEWKIIIICELLIL